MERGIGAAITQLHSGWDTNLRLKVLGGTALKYLTAIIRIRFRVRMPRTKEEAVGLTIIRSSLIGR